MATVIAMRKRPRGDPALIQRKFFKKTAKGKVIKVLRERYLRDDIPCGINECPYCITQQSRPLSLAVAARHSDYPAGHYVIPDTNIFLNQMDLMESPLFDAPLIVLQTVLEEVRHRSIPLHNRLKSLLRSEDRPCFVFYNEYREDTAVQRKDDESPNDMNDRAIRSAVAWYRHHIGQISSARNKGQPVPRIVLLTDDVANRRHAQTEGVEAVSVSHYVQGSKNSALLLDLLAAGAGDGDQGDKAKSSAIYPEHMSSIMINAGIKAGQLQQGHFNANDYNYLEASTAPQIYSTIDTFKGTVRVAAFPKPVLVVGRQNMNRAMHGDIVAIEVFPETEWRSPADAVVDQDEALKNDDADDTEAEGGDDLEAQEEARIATKLRDGSGKVKEESPTGRIVGIIKRNWRTYVCHLDPASLSSSSETSTSVQAVFAIPTSALLPRIRMRTRQAPQLLDQKILVTIDRWDSTSRYPEGHFVRSLGKVGGKEAEQEALLVEYGVAYGAFGKAIQDCLPPEGDSWVVPPKGHDIWKDREDLRDVLICSIDPPGCQDIDDALHARALPNGNIEAGVHIADVSHFVHAETPMDSEAAARGTTVYLVDKRIDMLPSLLGTNLCSLRPHVERLAFSVIWELTPEAKIVNVRFTKSVIASKSAFTYEEAQIRKDDQSLKDPLTQSIRLLNSLARNLREGRMRAGALNLASPEVKIQMESSESSDPIDVKQKEQLETNSLVEEFMLLANISVAKKIQETFPLTAVLRRHMPPPTTNFETLKDILMKIKGLKLDVSSSGALASSLDLCVDSNEPAFNTLVRIMATRCMLSAEYFCSGNVPRDTFGHYGLASPIYTHFTSPIRRYADVLVHRQLSAAINHAPLHASLHSKDYVERILNNVNRRHRMAQMASRASIEFYVGLAIQSRAPNEAGGVREEAYVIRTFRNGIAVFVSRLGIEGLVTFKHEIEYDAEAYAVTLPNGKKQKPVSLAVFDKVTVKITVEKDTTTQRGKVRMVLVSPVNSEAL
ncbi:probable DIS3 3`-5` exoribonuclease required for 3` end formation of 5.8S rRNA [Serendipita indica DSM 11827]|uniref:Ribosomal RNA-processing protein 44 n=1 Tax=Serendipita indica (strain DSM 11827) TaxID=1109443 RepID=G4TNI7_SERID|nr:probable DIS3 3`-5` exoribonuclease required for 3` end formation of 5.8S rRNA [Serendipita indica DSM 11827]